MTPNKRGNIEHMPGDEYRLADEEIKSAAEFERDSQKKMGKSGSSKSSREESKDSDGSQDSFDFSAPQRKDNTPHKSAESDLKSMNSE